MEFIQRYQLPTDESPPWSGIVFKLPIGSDTLAERLKLAYPNCRTLRERKHQATIDFFVEELRNFRTKDITPYNTADSKEANLSDSLSHISKSYSHTISDRSRPQSTSGGTSPSIGGSIDTPLVERVKPTPMAGLSPVQQPPTTPTANAQQFVWSSHDGRSLRPKTKRKMTLEERSAYKETRKRGACDKCRRQKGRCTHMIEEDSKMTVMDGRSRNTKRRISTGMDVNQEEGAKSVKTEQSLDVHHLTPEPTSKRRSSMSVQASNYGHTDELPESIEPPTLGNSDLVGAPQAASSNEGSSHSPLSPPESTRSSSSSKSPTPTNPRTSTSTTAPAE